MSTLIASVVVTVLTFIVQGFNFAMITSIIATALFCGRKVGYFCKFRHLVTLEVIGLFLTITFQLLFNRFVLVKTIIVVLLRLVFLGVAYYDMTAYVYVSKEVRRGEKVDDDSWNS